MHERQTKRKKWEQKRELNYEITIWSARKLYYRNLLWIFFQMMLFLLANSKINFSVLSTHFFPHSIIVVVIASRKCSTVASSFALCAAYCIEHEPLVFSHSLVSFGAVCLTSIQFEHWLAFIWPVILCIKWVTSHWYL